MDELKEYAELCAAQQRAIENYAKQLNKLKLDYDQLLAPHRERIEGVIKEIVAEAVTGERERCAALVEQFEPEYFYLGQVRAAANFIRAKSHYGQD